MLLSPAMIDFLRDLASNAARLVILAIIFIPLERIFSVRKQPILRRQFGADLLYYFVNGSLTAIVLGMVLGLVATLIAHIIPYRVAAFGASLPLWMRIAATFVIAEIGFYWGHRWQHEIPFLWRFHAVHHAAQDVDFLTNTRGHPLDMIFTRMCGFTPVVALGLGTSGAQVPVAIGLFGVFIGFFIHANLRWRLGWLEWVIATPAFHHWHHTNDEWRDHNYAPNLPILDKIFGTLHLPKSWPPTYGIDAESPSGFLDQILDPLDPRPAS